MKILIEREEFKSNKPNKVERNSAKPIKSNEVRREKVKSKRPHKVEKQNMKPPKPQHNGKPSGGNGNGNGGGKGGGKKP